MDQSTIKRLESDKAVVKRKYRANGFEVGQLYAKTATYEELLRVVEAGDGGIYGKTIFEGEDLGDYFRDLFEESPVIHALLDDFLAGWADGVRAFWQEMQASMP